MAYIPQNLTTFNPLIYAAVASNRTYTNEDDTLATISASGYFDANLASTSNTAGSLKVNDVIYAVGSDGADNLKVVTLNPITVTTNVEDTSLADGDVFVGNASNVATAVTMSGDATIVASGALTIAADAVTTAKILDANVTLPKLATGITPSHVVKFGAEYTTAGGAAAEAITVTGALATDIVTVQLKVEGVIPRTILVAAVSANTLTVTFSGDPANDHTLYYQILRAAV